jgi:septum formation protein
MVPNAQKIYLASKSPRRRELLRQIGVQFELLMLREHTPRGPDVTEAVMPGEPAHDYVARVTREKAECAIHIMRDRRLPLRPILTADTTVVVDGAILGKPADEPEAAAMLRALSGRSHEVLTAIALFHNDDMFQITQCSEVEFAALSDADIAAYCASGEPYDKAGGYGIQSAAAAFISRIAGSYTGIMGLPLFETAQLLKQAGIKTI